MVEVVAVGEWLYAGGVLTAVRVVRLDYDFWFTVAEANGDLMPGERPLLNGEGSAYYLRYKPGWSEGEPFWPDSVGYMTADEAKQEADRRLSGGVRWG